MAAPSANLMVREDNALAGLKAQLGALYNFASVGMNPPPDAVDGFLIRYVRSNDLHTSKAIEALKQRRDFEKALPGVSVTSYVVSSLRSGAFSVIGEDVMHRPILHVRLSNFRTSSDSSDTDRLLLVLLEYMQGLAMRHFSEGGLDGNGGGGVNASSSPNQNNNMSATTSQRQSRNGRVHASPSNAQNQEIVILIQDHDSGNTGGNGSGGGSGGLFANRGPHLISRITSLATKYYPNLVGAILVVDMGWAAQQTLRTNQAVQRVLDVVKPEHLGRFVDPYVLPEDLGGKKVKTNNSKARHKTCVEATNPIDFSQIVLRYWFNHISIILAEEGVLGGGVGARPLWQPLPIYFQFAAGGGGGGGGDAMGNSNTNIGGSSYHPNNFSTTSSRIRNRSQSGRPQSENGSMRGGGQFGDEDDGVCSVMTDETRRDGDVEEGGAAGGSGGLDEDGVRGLQAELQAERARRVQLENDLTKLTLGITLDDSTLTRLEVALKAVHGEVNVLISEVVQKSKATTTGVSGRAAAGGPSLQQLLEATNRSILQALQEKEDVPAMKFAQPTERRSKSSCVIS